MTLQKKYKLHLIPKKFAYNASDVINIALILTATRNCHHFCIFFNISKIETDNSTECYTKDA